MKKRIAMTSILLTIALTGLLFATNTEPGDHVTHTASHLAMNYFPDTMPDVLIDPMVEMPVF